MQRGLGHSSNTEHLSSIVRNRVPSSASQRNKARGKEAGEGKKGACVMNNHFTGFEASERAFGVMTAAASKHHRLDAVSLP